MTPYYGPIDGVTIYHGDCRDVMMSDAFYVDHVLTDPPYGVDVYLRMRSPDSAGGNQKHKIRGGDSITAMKHGAIGELDDDLVITCAELFAAMCRRWCIVFSDAEHTAVWRHWLTSSGLRYIRTGAWVKPDAMPQMTGDRPAVGFEPCTICHSPGPVRMRWNGSGRPALWTHNIVKGINRPDHPCPKPESLMLELVSQFTDGPDLICDPFMGSGTTLIAAKRLGRKAIGIEIEEKYCEIAALRLQQGALPLELIG